MSRTQWTFVPSAGGVGLANLNDVHAHFAELRLGTQRLPSERGGPHFDVGGTCVAFRGGSIMRVVCTAPWQTIMPLDPGVTFGLGVAFGQTPILARANQEIHIL